VTSCHLLLLITVLTTFVDAATMALAGKAVHFLTVKDAIDSAEMGLTRSMAVARDQNAPSSTQNSANSLSETESV